MQGFSGKNKFFAPFFRIPFPVPYPTTASHPVKITTCTTVSGNPTFINSKKG